MAKYTYRAVRIKQAESNRPLILFGAPATEIDAWAGVPQKKLLGENETIGFQRTLDDTRFESLVKFYREEANIIQNPLLCATRHGPGETVHFEPDEGIGDGVQTGTISILVADFEALPLPELLVKVKLDLEARVPELKEATIPDDMLGRLRQRASLTPDEGPEASEEMKEEPEDDAADDVSNVLASDESHILEFWQDVAARIQLLQEIGEEASEPFLGFSRDAMIAYLRPIMLVDGQHRLAGAIEAAKRIVDEERHEEIAAAIDDGRVPEEVERGLVAEVSRTLPISLLVTNDPAEHVFQFVVVNQRATPVGKALLGTIVSTSLSNEELERISDRLESAGIRLEESRVATQLARSPDSPFCGKVERGLHSDTRDLLPWPVFLNLTKIFRELEGAKFYHDDKHTDWARNWRANWLEKSGIVADWSELSYESPYHFWRERQGPWYKVFVAFWNTVRDRLGNRTQEDAYNYWGHPRTSNLFNKPTLMTLCADFFEFLDRGKMTIDSVNDIGALVDEWLYRVDKGYFDRPWDLRGNKKDNTGIRRRWSYEWHSYRTDSNPKKRLPNKDQYGKPLSART